jgi:1-acyl-sn-glycerol-3-phosphate acyltransferase
MAKIPRPTPEQLASLSPMERVAFEIGDASARYGTLWARAYNSVVLSGLVWASGGRRLHVHGVEHFAGMDEKSRVLLVANHRSFFDFFIVMGVTFWHTRLSRRIFFPVRGTFFYDHPLGPLVNGAMSAMRMFPPILREQSKRSFNTYSVERCVAELSVPGTLVGIHPEGTRNKGPDPYALLPTQLGVGRIALEAEGAYVVPLFVLGMGNSLPKELVSNWTAADDHRIDVHVGAPIDFSDLRPAKDRPRTMKRAAERCMSAIQVLAEDNRKLNAR